jgi:hypothetical protein
MLELHSRMFGHPTASAIPFSGSMERGLTFRVRKRRSSQGTWIRESAKRIARVDHGELNPVLSSAAVVAALKWKPLSMAV